MKPYHILKSFNGSQDGLSLDAFEAGTVRDISDHLANAIAGTNWIQAVDAGELAGGPHPELVEEPDAPVVLVESEIDNRETKVVEPEETKPAKPVKGKK